MTERRTPIVRDERETTKEDIVREFCVGYPFPKKINYSNL